MPDPAPITNPVLSEIASVGTGLPEGAEVNSPATLGVTDRSGKPIPDAFLANAISTGEAQFAPEQVYDLLDPDGLPKRVKGQHVYNAMRQGWSLESTEGKELRAAREKAQLGDKLIAGVLGAGEGLTFGILPAVVKGVGGSSAGKWYKGARAASEEAATVGEVLSLLTPMGVESLGARGVGAASKLGRGAMGAAEVLTYAPRAVNRAARRAGETVAGALPETVNPIVRRGVQLGTEGALEGSVYGAGFAVGEASLGNKELKAEQVLASAGAGALLGFGIGGGLGVAGAGASKAAQRIGAELPGFAEKMAFRTTGARGSELRKVGLDQARASGRRMLDEGLVGFGSLEERAAALRKATESAGKEVGDLINKIDETGQRPMLAPIIRKFDEQLGRLRDGVGADVKLAKKLDNEFGQWFRDRIGTNKTPTFKELHKIRGRVDDYLEAAKRGQDTVRQAELQRLRHNIEEEIQSQADKLARNAGDEFSNAYTAAKKRYKDLISAAEIAEKMAPMEASRSFGFYDKAAAAAAFMTMGPKGLLAAGASKLAREHGDAAVALLADKFSKKAAPKPTLAEVMSGARPVANDTFPTGLPAVQDLRGEMPNGLPSILDEAQGLTAPVTGQRSANNQWATAGANDNALKNVLGASNDNLGGTAAPLTPEQVAANTNAQKAARAEIKAKLEALGYIKEKADKVALQISKATQDAVSAGAHKVLPKLPAGAVAYETLAADAREHQIAPDRSATKIAARVQPLLASAPELASAVNAKLTGDLGYLASKLPSAGLAGLSPEQAKKVVPSGSERASFVRQAKAIQDPKTVIFDMKKGRLSDDALQAIRERRPLLFSKILEEAETAYAKLVAEGKAPSRQARLQFEKLTGRKLDPASNPIVIKVVQSIYREQAAAMAAPTTPTPQTSVKRADRLMSQSESIAYGEQ